MNKEVAVIGANGYIGKHLCKALTDINRDVIRLSAGSPRGISLETGLFSEALTFPQGLDTVYYLAQSPGYRQTPEKSAHLLTVNCVAAVQAAEAARRAGVRRFIYASTGNVYEPSLAPLAETAPVRQDNWYALSKVMAEQALALYRPYLDITVARIFGIYGPYQTDKLVPMIADTIQAGDDIFLDRNASNPDDMDGLSVSLLYIDDMVRALVSLSSVSHCDVINLGGLEAVTVRMLATELAQAMGLPLYIKLNDSQRTFNLITNTDLQIQQLGTPMISLSEGIKRFCHARASILSCNAKERI